MKTIKLILCFALLAVAGFSCTDSDPVSTATPTPQESVAVRTAFNEIKQANAAGRPEGRTANDPFCFEFIYPLTVQYNNGMVVTVNSFSGLLDIVLSETANQYVVGIAFPFSVQYQGAVTVIESEAEFTALLVSCGYNTLNNDLWYSYCFDLVFPIAIQQNGQTIVVETLEQFAAYVNTPTGGIVDIVFPISAYYEGQQITIANLYELYELINNCEDCACTYEYAPVCVQTATGILQFGNLCHALCSGYTQNDLVPCDGPDPCISNLTVTTGDCDNTGGSYQIVIDFDHTADVNGYFNVLVGSLTAVSYPLSGLPLTLNVPYSQNTAGYLTVNIIGTNCTASQQWSAPDCTCICTAVFDPVCVTDTVGNIQQLPNACEALCAGYTPADFVPCISTTYNFGALLGTCFSIALPVQIQHQGQLITADSNGQILQYWFPAQGPMPAFHYPITVTFDNTVQIVQNQSHFESLIETHCD
ncbi:hypothetical protein [Flavobacterium caeni]|uniref:Kazal-like domain-containing protein n=1 Tax=Flavobacterium caeni TaxID=490189 RepID=A0A1G5B5K2_9FLAO|nr:hypothetical protein [Flavobacterium caeni]SCX85310.1 hypothetical protein SAMN02927903_00257 [Flavobacterium caeni]